MLVTGVIVFSKVFGFVRDMILANYFGTGMANDAYVSAYSLFYLPVLLFNSCISATLIPLYVEQREQHSLAHSNPKKKLWSQAGEFADCCLIRLH